MTGVRVILADQQPNGLATMIAGLIEANLEHHPDRAELLHPAVVDLEAVDAGVTVSIRIEPGSVTVANGPSDPRADLRVRADSLALVELAATPLRLGVPDALHREGRAVMRKIASGQIRVDGMLRSPGVLTRLTRLLSVV